MFKKTKHRRRIMYKVKIVNKFFLQIFQIVVMVLFSSVSTVFTVSMLNVWQYFSCSRIFLRFICFLDFRLTSNYSKILPVKIRNHEFRPRNEAVQKLNNGQQANAENKSSWSSQFRKELTKIVFVPLYSLRYCKLRIEDLKCGDIDRRTTCR